MAQLLQMGEVANFIGSLPALPTSATAGAVAALAAGGTVARGVVIGATGSIGKIALIVAGILVMRRQKC